jgi:hypothetical protein
MSPEFYTYHRTHVLDVSKVDTSRVLTQQRTLRGLEVRLYPASRFDFSMQRVVKHRSDNVVMEGDEFVSIACSESTSHRSLTCEMNALGRHASQVFMVQALQQQIPGLLELLHSFPLHLIPHSPASLRD